MIGAAPQNKGMKLTSAERNGRSQLIPGVGRLEVEGWMKKTPIVFRTTHRIKFSELDPYNHVGTGRYATYYVDHRMDCLLYTSPSPRDS